MHTSTNLKILTMADTSAYPDVLDPLRKIAEVTELPARQELLLERIGEFDGFLTPLEVQSNREVLDRAEKLKVIVTPTTGTDHIDLLHAEERGITVYSLKEEPEFLNNITDAAEHAWALLLSLVRKLPWAFATAQQGAWTEKEKPLGNQLSGKTLGVVGYGRLGRIVAQYGKTFRMRVLVCGRRRLETPEGVEQVDFDYLVRNSDVISIHIHLTDENRHLFDSAAFAKTKPTAVLINTSRGAIIDEGAMLNALSSGRLAGAGVDVIEGEWRTDLKNHPLIQYSRSNQNLIITPHTGGATVESQSLIYQFMIQKLVRFFSELSEEN